MDICLCSKSVDEEKSDLSARLNMIEMKGELSPRQLWKR